MCVDFFTCRYGIVPDWHRGDEPADVPAGAYATRLLTDEAVALIENGGGGGDGPPWYVQVAYNAPHFGKGFDYLAGEPENVMQPSAADLALLDEAGVHLENPLRRAFAAKVAGMDAGVGRLLDALDATGQAENTLVIFMTDHGGDPVYGGSNAPLRGGKATLYEGGVRVPCVVRWPGVAPAGATTDAVASALDWFPTFAALGLCDPPPAVREAWDGESIAPLLRGEAMNDHRPVVWRTGPNRTLNRPAWAAALDGNWIFVRPPGPDGGPGVGELYDLAADPAETVDRAVDRPDVADRLRVLADAG